MSDTKYPVPTEEGLYQSGGQVWELEDDGMWGEIHGDGAEFGDHPFIRLVPETPKLDGPIEELIEKLEGRVLSYDGYRIAETKDALIVARRALRKEFLETHEKGAAWHAQVINAREELRGMMDSMDDHITMSDIHEAMRQLWLSLGGA